MPLFEIDFQSKLSVSYSVFSLTVVYGQWPAWTGLGNATLDVTYNATSPDGVLQPVFVVGSHSFAVTFTQPQNLIDFPFDKQAATFSFVNSKSTADNLFFVPAPAMTAPGNASSLYVPNIDGFFIESTGAAVDTRGPNSRVTITYNLARNPAFFVNRFVVPLSMVMVMAALFIGVDIERRMMVPLTAFASTVSFLFVSGQSVPQLPYSTRLDRYFQLCFFYAFAIFLYNIAVCAFPAHPRPRPRPQRRR